MKMKKMAIVLGVLAVAASVPAWAQRGGPDYYYCNLKESGVSYYSAVFDYEPNGPFDYSMIENMARSFKNSLSGRYSVSSYSRAACEMHSSYGDAQDRRDEEMDQDSARAEVVQTGWRP